MANGWARLGEALAGVTPAKRADIEARTMGQLAQRDRSVAQARDAMAKSEALASLGSYFADLDDPENLAGIARSGVNINTLYGGVGKRQEQGFRQAAVDAALGGDFGGANANLMGVARGPVEIPKVSGNMLLSNRLIPGGGDVTVTPIGQSMIDRNAAQGQAAMVRANRPAASGGGRAGAPKLSAVDSARMKAELRIIDAQIDPVLNDISTYAGATAGPGARKLADAEARLAELQRQQQAIFDKYEGGMPAEVDTTPNEPDDGIPVVDSGRSLGDVMTSDIQYQAPGGGQRTLPPDPAALRQRAYAIAQKFKADAQRAISKGADPAMVEARMKQLILDEMGR